MRVLLILAILVGITNAYGLEQPAAQVVQNAKVKTSEKENFNAKLEKAILEYQINQGAVDLGGLTTAQLFGPRDCDPNDGHRPPRDRGNCIDSICSKLGTFDCNEASEIERVGKLCRGLDVSCVNKMCSRMGTFDCNEISELERVGNTCRGVYNSDCIDTICSKMGTFDCNEISELERVGRACTGRVDSACINSVCRRMGTFDCNEISELEQVAQSCSGRRR